MNRKLKEAKMPYFKLHFSFFFFLSLSVYSSTDVRKQDAKFCDIFYFIYVVSWS